MRLPGPGLSLGTSALAAVGASACCALPLLLVMAGLGGTWLSTLHALYPYRWGFITIALAALAVAGWQIFRPEAACKPGEVCAEPAVQRRRKGLFVLVAGLAALGAASPYLPAMLT